jgi:hypothetical protein
MQLKSVPVALATAGMLAGSFVAISIPTAAKTKPVTITFCGSHVVRNLEDDHAEPRRPVRESLSWNQGIFADRVELRGLK